MSTSRLRRSGVALLAALSLGAALLAAPAYADTEEEPVEQPSGQLALTGDVGVHDPTMAYDEEAGLYVVASSHNSIRTAPTMEGPWTVRGNVPRADWTHDVPNSGTLWAPHLQKIGDTFYYYYSQSSFGSDASAIGVKTTKTPADPSSYVDVGHPVVESGALADAGLPIAYNAIDPAVVQDADGDWWMVWGSFWAGIVVQQLGDDLVSVVGEPSLIASRQADDNPVEGPALFHRDGYYYLVLSWDKCCSGADSTYKVAVGRSVDITGPYVDQAGVRLDEGGGTVILDSRYAVDGVTPDGLYRAPAGGDVYTEDGVNYFVYHAYRGAGSDMGIRPMEWRDGWPSFSDSDGGAYDIGDGSHIRLVSEAAPFDMPEIERVPGPDGFGTSVQLGGDSPISYVEMPDGIVSELDGDFTISTWLKRGTTFGNDWARLFDFGDSTDNFLFLTPSAAATPRNLRMELRTADGRNELLPGAGDSVTVGTDWTHVAVSASGTTAKLWVDGEVVLTNENFTLRPADLGFTTNNWIGRSQFSADPGLNGAVDDFNIFSRELSAEEMLAMTEAPGGGPSVGGGDVAWYQFDEGSGSEIVDSSASSSTATAVVPVTTEDELQNPVAGTQCLSAVDGSLTQTACLDGEAGQVWRLDAAEDNSYRLVGELATGNEQCVALADASGAPGTPVLLSECDADAELQRWFIEDTGHGFLRFSSPAANLALEIANDSGAVGAEIVGAVRAIRPIANMDPPQQWMPQHVTDEVAPVVSASLDQRQRIVAHAEDDLSGVSLIEYAIDKHGNEGEWREVEGPIQVDAASTVRLRAVDGLGNESDVIVVSKKSLR